MKSQAIGLSLLMLLLTSSMTSPQTRPPVTKPELLVMVASGMDKAALTDEIERRGLGFKVYEEDLWVLKEVGADDTTIKAVGAARVIPDYTFNYELLGSLYMQLQPQLDDLLRKKPGNPVLHWARGRVRSWTGWEPSEIEKEFRKAIQLKRDYATAYRDLGVLLVDWGRGNEGIAALQQAIQLQPDRDDLHEALGSSLAHLGDLDGAIAELRLAVRYFADDSTLHYALGYYLTRKGSVDDAVAELNEAIRLKPDALNFKTALNQALAKKSGLKAKITFKRVFETDEVQGAAWLDADGSRIYVRGSQTLGVIEWRKSKKETKKPAKEVTPPCKGDQFISMLLPIPNHDDLLIRRCDRLFVVGKSTLSATKSLDLESVKQFPKAAVSEDGSYVAVETYVRSASLNELVILNTKDWEIKGRLRPKHLKALGFAGDLLITLDEERCKFTRTSMSSLESTELAAEVPDCSSPFLDSQLLPHPHNKNLFAGVYWGQLSDFVGIRVWDLNADKLETEIPVAQPGYYSVSTLFLGLDGGRPILSPDWKFICGRGWDSRNQEFDAWDFQTGDVLFRDTVTHPHWRDTRRNGDLVISGNSRYVFMRRNEHLVLYEVQPN